MPRPACHCRHWSPLPPPGADDGGLCAIGVTEQPSLGTCSVCPQYDGPEPRVTDYLPLTLAGRPIPPPAEAIDPAERELLEAALNPQEFGDHVAALIRRVGADRAWKMVRGLDEAGCAGCNERRKWLNEAHARLKDWLGRLWPGG